MTWEDILKALVQYTGTCSKCGQFVSKAKGDTCPKNIGHQTCPMQFTTTDSGKEPMSKV